MNKMYRYIEKRPEQGRNIEWDSVTIHDQLQTQRGTLVEMIHRPDWGMACYMDNQIQSCERDEKLYHEALVHPAMAATYCKTRIMIIGGGEGATLREVVKWNDVKQIDMYEWDKEVIDLFQTKYPQWAKGAWTDPRVTLRVEDIMKVICKRPDNKYDVIIIDLFDPSPENELQWRLLFDHLPSWLQPAGTIVIYAGIRSGSNPLLSILDKSTFHVKNDMFHPRSIQHQEVIPYRVYIPSFSGESEFLLLKSRAQTITFETMKKISHIDKKVWNAYRVEGVFQGV